MLSAWGGKKKATLQVKLEHAETGNYSHKQNLNFSQIFVFIINLQLNILNVP